MATTSYTYILGAQHDNQLPLDNWADSNGAPCTWNAPGAAYVSGGLPCDGTVYVSSGDSVCYANVKYIIDGVSYKQNIMNVPFQDALRLPLYFQYFVNNQVVQLSAQ